jgi:CheY-like chemotaxis protein
MYFLIVEDDKSQYSDIEGAITQIESVRNSQKRIERFATESEFIDNFESIARDKPDVIILDIMLRWTDPAPDMKLPPPDIAEQGFFRAGVRCERRLAADPRTRDIPIIVYSMLEKEDLKGEIPHRPEVSYLEKDFGVEELKNKLEKLLAT